jgi:hypothetical protein
MKKTKTLALRITDKQNEKLEDIRNHLDLNNISDVLRMLIDNYDKSSEEHIKELQTIKKVLKSLI